jgi:hypothetical protein
MEQKIVFFKKNTMKVTDLIKNNILKTVGFTIEIAIYLIKKTKFIFF